MKLLSCLRAPDAKRVLPPATVVASRSSPLTCEAGAAPRQLSLGGQVDGGSLAPDHLSVPFLKNGSRCSWADLDSSSDDRLVAATVRCDSHHQQRFERKGTSWPWVPAGAIASREPRFWRGQKPLSMPSRLRTLGIAVAQRPPFPGLPGPKSQMAAAADLGQDSWRRPAFAGAPPACRI